MSALSTEKFVIGLGEKKESDSAFNFEGNSKHNEENLGTYLRLRFLVLDLYQPSGLDSCVTYQMSCILCLRGV